MITVTEICAVASGGALGATVRFAAQQILPFRSRISLILINLLGCLLIGILWRLQPSRIVSLLFITGLLGGFTTFSTFSFDTLELIREGRLLAAAGYIGISVIGGLILTAAGWYMTGYITHR